MTTNDFSILLAAASQNYKLNVNNISPLGAGKVNETFLVKSSSGLFVLQKLNDFFNGDPAFGSNWCKLSQAAQKHDALKDSIPAIFPDHTGELISEYDGSFFRLTSYLEGHTPLRNQEFAHKAGQLLGHCHHIMNDPAPLELEPLPEGEFTNQKLCNANDFQEIADIYHGHPHWKEMQALLDQATEAAWQLPMYPFFVHLFHTHDLAIHGDPKHDNFLCCAKGCTKMALLDWDSLSYGHLLIDLAEMIRSWAIKILPNGSIKLDIDIASSVISGYALSGLPLNDEDAELLPPVLRAIAVNLCRRYITDAFAEVYFKWNPEQYPSLYKQNRSRAENMLKLAQYVSNKELEISKRLKKTFTEN